MNNRFWTLLLVAALAGLAIFFWQKYDSDKSAEDYKNATYIIENENVTLSGGVYEEESVPGSAVKIITRYFGNEVRGDFNGDSREDVVFLLTRETGGSGTFFYVTAAVGTSAGFEGANAIFLGDRIAPQSTEVKGDVIVVNYSDRALGEPMSSAPSVGVSRYFKLEGKVLVEVNKDAVPDENGAPVACTADAKLCPDGSYVGRTGPKCEFAPCPGASDDSGISGTVWLGPICPVEKNPPDPNCADRPYKTSLVVTSSDSGNVIASFSSDSLGKFKVQIAPGEYSIRSSAAANVLPYCASDGTVIVKKGVYTNVDVSCDSGIR